jgi:hypothetical protein
MNSVARRFLTNDHHSFDEREYRDRGWGVESATHRSSAAMHCPESNQEFPERGNFLTFIAVPANAFTLFSVSETVGAP